MTLEEARAIVSGQIAADSARSVEAVAMMLRYRAISDPRLLRIATSLEHIATEIAKSSEADGKGIAP